MRELDGNSQTGKEYDVESSLQLLVEFGRMLD